MNADYYTKEKDKALIQQAYIQESRKQEET